MSGPNKIFVAYKTRLRENVELDFSHLSPPANYKDQAKIAQWLEEKRIALTLEADTQPHTATFAEVIIVDSANKKQFNFAYRAPGSGRQPISAAIRDWILKQYPKAWQDNTHQTGAPEAIFVGFEPRRFLKIIGLECARSGQHLPLSLWYNNSDHRDIQEVFMPSEVTVTGWKSIMNDFGCGEIAKDWAGPGLNLDQDLKIMLVLAASVGMF